MVTTELDSELRFSNLIVVTATMRWMYGASLGIPIRNMEIAARRLCNSGVAIGAVSRDKWYGTETDHLRILNRLDKKFVDLGYARIVRAELPPIRVKPVQLRQEHINTHANDAMRLRVYLLLHHNGSMVISVILEIENESRSLLDTVKVAEIGLEDTLLDCEIPPSVSWEINWATIEKDTDGDWIQHISLQTFLDRIVVPRIGQAVLGRRAKSLARSTHSLGQYTLNAIVDSVPRCSKIDTFVQQYGIDLKSISDMDINGYTRSPETIRERFNNNYSIDDEVGVFLGHRSGTIIFQWPQIEDWFSYASNRYYKGLDSRSTLALEVYQHYAVFVEWLLIEESSTRSYLQQLDHYIQYSFGNVRTVLHQKRQMVQELDRFHDTLTSFEHGTRIISSVGNQRSVEELHERFEQKRSLVQEIVVDAEDRRLQTVMSTLNIVLIASLFLELTELQIQYLKISPGSTEWLTLKLAAVALVPLLIVLYFVIMTIARIVDFVVVRDSLGSLLGSASNHARSTWVRTVRFIRFGVSTMQRLIHLGWVKLLSRLSFLHEVKAKLQNRIKK